MRTRFFLTSTAAFIAVMVTGGLWAGAVERIAPGQPGLGVALMGAAFSLAFVWLLLARLRSLLASPSRRRIEFALLGLNFAILVLAFAWVHSRIGLMDFSTGVPRATKDFGDALYFSVITITTLGYGDFAPIGVGRTVAALQALMGYFTLGMLVSTGYQFISPHTDIGARSASEQRDEDEELREVLGSGAGSASE